MNIHLDASTERLIQNHIEAGRYQDADAVVRDALDALEERVRLYALRAAIAEGDADFEHGDVIRWTPTFMDEIIAEINERGRQSS